MPPWYSQSGWLLLATVILLALAACSPSQLTDRDSAGTGLPEEGLPPSSGETSFGVPPGFIEDSTPFPATTEPLQRETRAATTEPATQIAPKPTPILSPKPPVFPLAGIQLSRLYTPEKLRLVAEAGAHWTKRNGLIWSVVEPAEGLYNWGNVASLEAELLAASERGLEMILVVQGTPIWAQEIFGYPCGPIAPDKLSAFGDFLYEAVHRYSAPPFNVRFWEIWNEPDASWQKVDSASPYGCWGDNTAPYFGGGYFGEMLQAVYPRIKEANPEAQVLFGGLLLDCDPLNPPDDPSQPGTPKDCASSTFLEGVLQNGGGAFFDGVSFHAYDLYYGALGDYRNPNWHSSWTTTGPVLIAKARYLRSVLDAYGYGDKYLLNTEGALLCGSSGQEPICLDQDYSDTKASYLAQTLAAAQAEGLLANVWYSLSGWRGSQLLSESPLLLNDSYRAFTTSANFLDGAAYLGPVNGYSGVTGYRFLRGDMEIWLAWSLDGGLRTLNLPQEAAVIYDILGERQSSGQELEITQVPVWVMFPN